MYSLKIIWGLSKVAHAHNPTAYQTRWKVSEFHLNQSQAVVGHIYNPTYAERLGRRISAWSQLWAKHEPLSGKKSKAKKDMMLKW
jgi:hypothetical protein